MRSVAEVVKTYVAVSKSQHHLCCNHKFGKLESFRESAVLANDLMPYTDHSMVQNRVSVTVE